MRNEGQHINQNDALVGFFRRRKDYNCIGILKEGNCIRWRKI